MSCLSVLLCFSVCLEQIPIAMLTQPSLEGQMVNGYTALKEHHLQTKDDDAATSSSGKSSSCIPTVACDTQREPRSERFLSLRNWSYGLYTLESFPLGTLIQGAQGAWLSKPSGLLM